MSNRFNLIYLLIFFISVYSCKTARPVVNREHYQSQSQSQAQNDYINRYKDLAISEMKRTGIPASITLAQGIIESDWGRSTIATEANNHFGIKCHNGWSGLTIKHTDNSKDECFRKYNRPEDSFYDHSDFLKTTSRYQDLFSLQPTDYKSWAHGLKKDGYATNPQYAGLLIRTIEENSLWSYDQVNPDVTKVTMVQNNKPLVNEKLVQDGDSSKKQVGDSSKKQVIIQNTAVVARVPRISENNRIQFIIVKDGETKEKIENEFQLLGWELSRYNELKNDFIPVPGQILYLQPKRERAEAGKEFYTTVEGDSMYSVSQKFGIKLKNLYQMNRMEAGTEPETGSKIWLRQIKPLQ